MAKTKEKILTSPFIQNLFLCYFKVLHFLGTTTTTTLNLYFAIRRLPVFIVLSLSSHGIQMRPGLRKSRL